MAKWSPGGEGRGTEHPSLEMKNCRMKATREKSQPYMETPPPLSTHLDVHEQRAKFSDVNGDRLPSSVPLRPRGRSNEDETLVEGTLLALRLELRKILAQYWQHFHHGNSSIANSPAGQRHDMCWTTRVVRHCKWRGEQVSGVTSTAKPPRWYVCRIAGPR